MSGILGILHVDDAPVARQDLAAMASLLERRGPDGTGLWSDGPAGLGHTLLATTPELAAEPQPVRHESSGCVITADLRLDNRAELLEALGLSGPANSIGDAGLVLQSYLAWGEDCAERLLGDFAFAIWDPRRRALFCARDQFAMRPFYYHYSPSRFFIFASEPRGILVLPQVPFQVNEGRIADYLVPELQWMDYTSTFFEGVFRLPPAHSVTITNGHMQLRRYWQMQPGPELRLPSDEAYAEALREVLTQAIQARLRAAGPVGAMLSGGLDSSSVVAIAKDLWWAEHGTPLFTFSGAGPAPEACIETRMIHECLSMSHLQPQLVDYSNLSALMPELKELSLDADEPFDFNMVILRSVCLAARGHGIRVLLDGAGGDVALSWGTYITRLFKQGRWWQAFRTGYGLDRYFSKRIALGTAFTAARWALPFNPVRPLLRWRRERIRVSKTMRQSIINPDFARRISLGDRLFTLDQTCASQKANFQEERAASILPNMTAGRERYNRVASAVGLEPRDPFMDRRVLEFCATLPGEQCLGIGWPKVILRRAMTGRLPDTVRWRRGRHHLGWDFNCVIARKMATEMCAQPQQMWDALAPFVDLPPVQRAFREYAGPGDQAPSESVLQALTLSAWLQRLSRRPLARNSEPR